MEASGDGRASCAISGEPFEKMYNADEDKWYLVDAVVLTGGCTVENGGEPQHEINTLAHSPLPILTRPVCTAGEEAERYGLKEGAVVKEHCLDSNSNQKPQIKIEPHAQIKTEPQSEGLSAAGGGGFVAESRGVAIGEAVAAAAAGGREGVAAIDSRPPELKRIKIEPISAAELVLDGE